MDRGKTREETISRLAQHIDSFERYTTPHSALMAELASQLARMLGMSETDISAVAEAARLHDIGLYAIAPGYYSSSEGLSFEQRLDLWRHSVVGEQQMAKREANRHAQLLVRWHHEWWNGTGYPDQLAFEDIPIGARLLRAVELYCALISDRPYRRALEPAEALEALAGSAGVECDPYVVAALLSLLDSLTQLEQAGESVPPEKAPVTQSEVIAEDLESLENVFSGEETESFSPGDAALTTEESFPPSIAPSTRTAPVAEPATARRSTPPIGELLIQRARTRERVAESNANWRAWTASRYNRKTLLGFEASVLRQIEFRSIAIPYWSTARLDWYLKAWDKQIYANDPSAWCSTAAKAMVEAAAALSEEEITRLLEDVYVPGVRLQNPELKRWFAESDAFWMDNLRRNIERMDDDAAKAQAMLLGMQTGDYALSFNDQTRDLRQPLTTILWRLAGRTVTVPGSPRNHSSNLPVEEFMRLTRADLLYLKLPPASSWSAGSKLRAAWRESWVTGANSQSIESRREPQSKTAYLASIDRLLRLAGHIRTWAIGHQESGLCTAHEVAEVIKQHRPIRATYSKDLTELLGGLRSFIIVADSSPRA